MIIGSGDALIDVRTDVGRVAFDYSRSAELPSVGPIVIVGDGGRNPALLTVTFRIASTNTGDAVVERNAAAAVVHAATALASTLEGRVTYLLGTRSLSMRLRGTWWEFTATFAARALTDQLDGTGEVLTHSDEALTLGGVPLTIEVE